MFLFVFFFFSFFKWLTGLLDPSLAKVAIRADYGFQKGFLFLLGKEAQCPYISFRSYDHADIYLTQTGARN